MTVIILTFVVCDCSVAISCLCPGEFHELPVMACGCDHPAVCFDLSCSLSIAEVLAALVAAPVCAVSCCRAGGCYCCMCCHVVACSCDHPAVCFDLSCSLSVAEVLTALIAAPVCAVSCGRAGGCYCCMCGHVVACSCDHPAVFFDLSCSLSVTEVLAALVAAPVCAVSCGRAGGCYCCMCGHVMTCSCYIHMRTAHFFAAACAVYDFVITACRCAGRLYFVFSYCCSCSMCMCSVYNGDRNDLILVSHIMRPVCG